MSARSPLLLESEALKLIFPVLTRLESGHRPVCCIARGCMAWREIDATAAASAEREVVGYCALMSTPPQVQDSFATSMFQSMMHAAGLVKNNS